MGFHGNNERTFAEYIELDIAVNDDSPNAYIYKSFDSEIDKSVSQKTWYVRIPIPNKGNGKRLSLRILDLSSAKNKAIQKLEERTVRAFLIIHKQHFLVYTIMRRRLSHQNWHQNDLLHVNTNVLK